MLISSLHSAVYLAGRLEWGNVGRWMPGTESQLSASVSALFLSEKSHKHTDYLAHIPANTRLSHSQRKHLWIIFYCFCDILKWQAWHRHLSLPGRFAGDVVSVPQAVDFALICLRKRNKRFLWDSVPVTAMFIYRHHEKLCIHNNLHTNMI